MVGDRLSAQVAVLGSLLIEPKLVGEALSKVRVEDFTDNKCRMVFQAIKSLFTAGAIVDPTTVRDKLGGLSDGEWSSYLLELMDRTPTAAHIWEYAKLMREQARMAKVVELAGLLQVSGDSDTARGYIAKLNGLLAERQGVKRMNMEQMLASFWERHTTPHEYLSWGLEKLNGQMYTDLGDMVVLGGYPSAGKTALAVTFAYHQSLEHRVGFYSLETNRYKLADRLIANMAGVDMASIKRGTLSEQQWELVAHESPRILKHDLTLVEASGMSVQDIQADALANRYDIVYVDYLQLIEPESRKMGRTEQVSGISRGLQQLAHGNDILVVALSQLVRADRQKDDSKVSEPTMSDLRESGQIEQDADAIMLLFLEEPTRPNESRRVLKIAKNKEGERGRIFLVFSGEFQRFRESVVDQPSPAPVSAVKQQRNQVSFAERFWEGIDEDPFQDRKQEGA